jgi:ABC-type Fe3+-hydroxamate transport system substrate-binding protein
MQRRYFVWIPVLCVLLAACSSSAKSATTATTTSPPSTTAPTTTTAATTSKESVYVVSVDPAAHTITVDPMEFLTGSVANAAYRHDNPASALKTPPDDYYIVNPTKDHVVLPLAPDAPIRVLRTATTTLTNPATISASALAHQSELKFRPFWITIERGSVSDVEEQYIP